MATQQNFVNQATIVVKSIPGVVGLMVAGSWLTSEVDEFSDVDLILVTEEKVSGDKSSMLEIAGKLGSLISGFTGEHVGEPRLLICLYNDPLLHVDIKFVTIDELSKGIEKPFILYDATGAIWQALAEADIAFPYPDYQWVEDRFWTWAHYALLKIGRGEYLEALDFFGFLRMTVLGPLLHIKNGNLPRGVRKVETQLLKTDLDKLLATVATHNKTSLINALENAIELYRQLRIACYKDEIATNESAEEMVINYLHYIKKQSGTRLITTC